MGKFTGWLTTLALGAGLMYLYDPDRGIEAPIFGERSL
jgi:hypothetical protein